MTLNEMLVYFGSNGNITTSDEAEKFLVEVRQAFQKYAIYKVQYDWCQAEGLDVEFPQRTKGQQMAENAMRSLAHHLHSGAFCVPSEFKTQKRGVNYLASLMDDELIADKVAVYSYSPSAAYRKAAYWFGQASGASICVGLSKSLSGSSPWSPAVLQGYHDSISQWVELKLTLENAKPEPLTRDFAQWAAYQKLVKTLNNLVV